MMESSRSVEHTCRLHVTKQLFCAKKEVGINSGQAHDIENDAEDVSRPAVRGARTMPFEEYFSLMNMNVP